MWCALTGRALEGDRTWSNVADLVFAASVSATTACLALERAESNGAIDRYRRGRLAVVSIDQQPTMLHACRNLASDTIAWTIRDAIASLLDSAPGPHALGGPDAATALLGGHAVADFQERIMYMPPSADLSALPESAVPQMSGYRALSEG